MELSAVFCCCPPARCSVQRCRDVVVKSAYSPWLSVQLQAVWHASAVRFFFSFLVRLAAEPSVAPSHASGSCLQLPLCRVSAAASVQVAESQMVPNAQVLMVQPPLLIQHTCLSDPANICRLSVLRAHPKMKLMLCTALHLTQLKWCFMPCSLLYYAASHSLNTYHAVTYYMHYRASFI